MPTTGAFSGSLSAEGRDLSFTNWETGDLGIQDLKKNKDHLLTNSGGWEKSGDFTEQSIISPDGRQIVFTSSRGSGPRRSRA